jgi:hypothetical protein
MNSLLVLFILACAISAQTPPLPVWPPAPEFRVSIQYSPGLYDVRTQNLNGAYFYSAKLNRYAIDSKDPLRTFEKAYFQEDKKDQYVLSKFGEFSWSCKKFVDDGYTKGNISFVPPFGLNDWWLQKSKYQGQISCGSEKCDVYEYNNGKKTVTSWFRAGTTSNRELVQIEEIEGGETIRKAQFSVWTPGPQSSDLFVPPATAKCK